MKEKTATFIGHSECSGIDENRVRLAVIEFKKAIVKRNEYLMENSAYAICYVRHNWGGAAKTYEKAIENGVVVIEL